MIGVRDTKDSTNPCGLRIYGPATRQGAQWTRRVIDPGSGAIEDLAVGDLDGDGRPEIVAAGRRTNNVRSYRNAK